LFRMLMIILVYYNIVRTIVCVNCQTKLNLPKSCSYTIEFFFFLKVIENVFLKSQ